MAKGGVDDAMFCEACGLHRDQLGVAGQDMKACPDCGRATCANCWNQVAVGCLTCRPFALPAMDTSARTGRTRAAAAPVVAIGAAAVTSTATSASAPAKSPKRPTGIRGTKGASKGQPDPVVTQMPGVVEAVPVSAAAARSVARPRTARFGHIRLGRVVRATAIGSALAISITAVVFAGVIRLAPSGVAGTDGTPPSTEPGLFLTDPGSRSVEPITSGATFDPTATAPPGDPGRTSAPGATGPHGGSDPTNTAPGATPRPGSTATPAPTGGATPAPTATPTPTSGPTATPTPAPTPTPTPDPTPTPTPDPTPTPTPDPTPTPTPDPTPTPTPDPTP